MRSFAAILISSVFAAGFAAPAQADVCSDHRQAVFLRDAMGDLVTKRLSTTTPGTPEYRDLIDLEWEAADQLDAAQRAVLANLDNEAGATIIRSLYALKASANEIWYEGEAWGAGSEQDGLIALLGELISIRLAITRALEAAFDLACR